MCTSQFTNFIYASNTGNSASVAIGSRAYGVRVNILPLPERPHSPFLASVFLSSYTDILSHETREI